MPTQDQPHRPAEFYPRWRTRCHFIVGLIFITASWLWSLLRAFYGISRSCLAGHSPEEYRRNGQKNLSDSFKVTVGGLIHLGILRLNDDELLKKLPLSGPLIVASNHPAIWDALLIVRRCDEISCIMKGSLLSNPLLRHGALFAGFLPNAPRLHMLRSAVSRLQEGGQLLLFPEGTRTREENQPLNPFLSGMSVIASQSQAPLLPIFISTNSRYLQKGWPIWKMPDLPITITVRVGDVQELQPGEKARQFSDRMETLFREQLTGP